VKRSRILLLVLTVSLLAVLLLVTSAFAAGKGSYFAALSGANEVPPVETDGQGRAVFLLNQDGTALSYRLMAINLDDIVQAHIHCGAPGVNGPVVVFLFGPFPEGSDREGVLATGNITNASIIPRPDSPACPGGVASFADLLAKIESGQTYVNVHTHQWPGGEIRGPIE
jgi:hypothetical protein